MLMISKSRRISRRQLNLIPVPKRPDTKLWKGVPHGQLATAVMHEAKERQIPVISEDWCISTDRQRMLGVLTFGQPETMVFPSIAPTASPMNFSMGIRHSNMGHYAISFCLGARVAICDNGMFAGQYVVKKRHVADLDLAGLVKKGFDTYLKESHVLANLVSSYLGVPMTDRDAAYAVMCLVADTGLKNTYADDVWRQWQTPAHPEFEDRNLWTFYNAMTEVAKGMTPDIQLRLLTRAKPVLEGIFLAN